MGRSSSSTINLGGEEARSSCDNRSSLRLSGSEMRDQSSSGTFILKLEAISGIGAEVHQRRE